MVKRFLQGILQNKTYRLFLNVGIILLSFSVIGFLLYRNWNEISKQKISFNYWYLIAAIIANGPAFFFTAASWDSLLKSMGIFRRFSENLRIYGISALPKHIPGVVFYVTSRILQYQSLGVTTGPVLVAIAVEVVLLSSTGFIIGLGLLLKFTNQENAGILWIAGILSFIVLLFFDFFENFIRKLIRHVLKRKAIELPKFDKKFFRRTILFMFLAWVFGGLVLFFTINAITDLNINQLPLVISIWAASGAMSLSIGAIIQGFGIREITMAATLSTILPPVIAVVVALGFRIIFTLAELIWVGIILTVIRLRPTQRNDE